ncbi:hypothetical protein CK203_065395 [Vitis vinifera]|uniref:Uncharacterized protein n=1 Tax=Vitis vinifera TaxID=29760 RepID=A0A438FNS0_VITVI|nr:hypothetical protein CK203_065395 [Vitis vinifera]
MSVEVLDGATIVSFVEDEEAFNDELAHVYDSLFVKFDHDANGAVDLGGVQEGDQTNDARHGQRVGVPACSDGPGRRTAS